MTTRTRSWRLWRLRSDAPDRPLEAAARVRRPSERRDAAALLRARAAPLGTRQGGGATVRRDAWAPRGARHDDGSLRRGLHVLRRVRTLPARHRSIDDRRSRGRDGAALA